VNPCIRSGLVVVRDLDIARPLLRPPEADAVLVVDPDCVLPGARALQLVKPVPRRHKLSEVRRRFERDQLAKRDIPDLLGTDAPCLSRVYLVEDVFGAAVAEADDHG
jgi:hypothetical protein